MEMRFVAMLLLCRLHGRTWLHLCMDAMLLSQILPSTNTAHQDFRQTRIFLIILASPSQNTQFFLVSVRYPCVSLTRFLVDVASIIEMEDFFLVDNCSNVYQETCEAYARMPHGYKE